MLRGEPPRRVPRLGVVLRSNMEREIIGGGGGGGALWSLFSSVSSSEVLSAGSGLFLLPVKSSVFAAASADIGVSVALQTEPLRPRPLQPDHTKTVASNRAVGSVYFTKLDPEIRDVSKSVLTC